MQKMYVLRTLSRDRRYLGLTKNEKSYVFAFPEIKHAHLANKNVSTVSTFEIIPRKILNDVCLTVDLKIVTDLKNCTNTEILEIEQQDMIDLLTMPLVNNIGLVIATDVLNNSDPDISELNFESILISPFDLFRSI